MKPTKKVKKNQKPEKGEKQQHNPLARLRRRRPQSKRMVVVTT